MEVKVKKFKPAGEEMLHINRMVEINLSKEDWNALSNEGKATVVFLADDHETPITPGDLIYIDDAGAMLIKNKGIRMLSYDEHAMYITETQRGNLKDWIGESK